MKCLLHDVEVRLASVYINSSDILKIRCFCKCGCEIKLETKNFNSNIIDEKIEKSLKIQYEEIRRGKI